MDLGRVVPQFRFEPDGHPYDLGLVDLKALVEADSSHHREELRMHRDTEDVTEASIRGWPLLRFSYATTVHHVERVEAAVLTVAARQRLVLPRTAGIQVRVDHGYRSPVR